MSCFSFCFIFKRESISGKSNDLNISDDDTLESLLLARVQEFPFYCLITLITFLITFVS